MRAYDDHHSTRFAEKKWGTRFDRGISLYIFN